MNKNKGFTLIELLAVIVVLAIIMIIATTQVNKTIKRARADSFVSSYNMIAKEVKRRISVNDMTGSNYEEIECNDESGTPNYCYKIYDFSKDNYVVKILPNGVEYSITMIGKGKFAKMDLDDPKSGVKCPVEGACTVTSTEDDIKGQVIRTIITEEGKEIPLNIGS